MAPPRGLALKPNWTIEMNRTLLALLAVSALAGCATPRHECELGSDKDGARDPTKCASMGTVYEAVRSGARGKANVLEAGAAPVAGPGTVAPIGVGAAAPDPGQVGMPVFKQPRVNRVWVAPYVDADGNLRSGEYTYYSTAGEWTFGTMNKPRTGSAVFGPTKPDAYGFKPVIVTTPTTQSPQGKPNGAAPQGPASAPGVPGGTKRDAPQGAAQTSTETPANSITQPYERLN